MATLHAAAITSAQDPVAGTAAEQWRAIAGAPGYEVSDLGRVRGVDRTVHYRDGRTFHYRGALLNPATNPVSSYQHVKLKGVSRNVHALVLHAFVGPPPERGMVCRHLNGNPTDNRLSNLRWGTQSENCYDTVAHGRHRQAEQVTCGRGHLLVNPNLTQVLARRGVRGCLACDRATSAVAKAALNGHPPLDIQAVADRRYALIMAGRPSGRLSFTGTELIGLDRDWVVITTRRRFAHARAKTNPGVAVCGRVVITTADVVSDWSELRQCRNCARLIVAGVGWE